MSQHNFDTDIAKEYGIESAIIIQNLSFWIEKNKANGSHFHDGSYWTYNSIKAFNELFPYMSESTIRRTLKSLEENGIIKTGNYNKVGYDRTMWYAITEKGFSILNKSICHFEQIESSKTSNGISQSSEPIPDNKPVKKQDIKHVKENQHKEIYDVYISAYENMFGIKPLINYPSVSKLITKHLQSITKEQIIDAINIAKTDDFCSKKTPFELATILSNNVIMRLVNESRIQNSSSLPKTNTAPAAEVTCCGQKYSHEIGFCKVCGKSYNRDGSER